jgi:hypothetical protein
MSQPGDVPQRISYRGWETPFALPNQHDLDSLGPNMLPFAFVPFDSVDMIPGGVVPAGGTSYGSCTQEDDCWITHLVGSIINPQEPGAGGGSFTAQVYDSDRQKLWTPQPFLFGNLMGTARRPFFFRKPYLLPLNAELKCSIVNLSTFDAQIQVVAWGLRKDIWKAVS